MPQTVILASEPEAEEEDPAGRQDLLYCEWQTMGDEPALNVPPVVRPEGPVFPRSPSHVPCVPSKCEMLREMLL